MRALLSGLAAASALSCILLEVGLKLHVKVVLPGHVFEACLSCSYKRSTSMDLLLFSGPVSYVQANLACGCGRTSVNPSQLHCYGQLHQLLEPLRPGKGRDRYRAKPYES